MLFGNAHIKITVRILFFKGHQARALTHGRGNAHQTRIGSRLVTQPLAKNLRVSGFGNRSGFDRPSLRIHFTDGMKTDRIVFSQFVALTFFGDDVQQLRAGLAAQMLQGFHQQGHIMAINRASVIEAKFFKQRNVRV